MDTSKQILVVPKFVFHVRTMARTKDSSRKHDNVRQDLHINACAKDHTPDEQIYDFHDIYFRIDPEKRIMVRSIKYPKMMDTGI